MQIDFNDVGSGEPLLGQAGEEEFVDDPFPRDANPALLFASPIGSLLGVPVASGQESTVSTGNGP